MNKNTMLLQVECTYFFEENPYAIETKKSLALRLGRSADDLEPVLNNLVSLTILTRSGDGEDSIYRYNRPMIIHERENNQWKET